MSKSGDEREKREKRRKIQRHPEERDDELQKILIELKLSKGQAIHHAIQIASRFDIPSFHLDTSYDPVPITPTEMNTGEQNVILRGTIDENRIKELEDLPDVISWEHRCCCSCCHSCCCTKEEEMKRWEHRHEHGHPYMHHTYQSHLH